MIGITTCSCVFRLCYKLLVVFVTILDESQTAEAETMETGDQPADTSVIEGDRYVVITLYFSNYKFICVIDEIYLPFMKSDVILNK